MFTELCIYVCLQREEEKSPYPFPFLSTEKSSKKPNDVHLCLYWWTVIMRIKTSWGWATTHTSFPNNNDSGNVLYNNGDLDDKDVVYNDNKYDGNGILDKNDDNILGH